MYRIRDWNLHFENNRTRELKELRFVIIPNKQDGDGYTELMDHPNGPSHYAAWIGILQVASKGSHPAGGCGIPAGCCECRGTLLRDGARSHDPASLARLTRIPASVFEEALPRLVVIGWLDVETIEEPGVTDIPQEVAQIPQGGAEKREISAALTRARGTEQNGIEQNRKQEEETTPSRAKRSTEQRGSRLPDDFELSESLKAFAVSDAPHVRLEIALAEFKDYWRSIPGARGRKIDWEATFRNRLRELEGRRNGNGTSQPQPNQTAAERRNAAIIRNQQRAAELRSLGDERVGSILRREPGSSSG